MKYVHDFILVATTDAFSATGFKNNKSSHRIAAETHHKLDRPSPLEPIEFGTVRLRAAPQEPSPLRAAPQEPSPRAAGRGRFLARSGLGTVPSRAAG